MLMAQESSRKVQEEKHRLSIVEQSENDSSIAAQQEIVIEDIQIDGPLPVVKSDSNLVDPQLNLATAGINNTLQAATFVNSDGTTLTHMNSDWPSTEKSQAQLGRESVNMLIEVSMPRSATQVTLENKASTSSMQKTSSHEQKLTTKRTKSSTKKDSNLKQNEPNSGLAAQSSTHAKPTSALITTSSSTKKPSNIDARPISSITVNSLIAQGQMLRIPKGDFKNDANLNPLGLPQKTMEECMKIQTEITSRINRAHTKIKEQTSDFDELLKNMPKEFILAGHQVGPLNPNCALAEDEFSPNTLGDSTAPTREQFGLRAQKHALQSDFTSSVATTTLGTLPSSVLHANLTQPAPQSFPQPVSQKLNEVIINQEENQKVQQARSNNPAMWSTHKNQPQTARQSLHKSDEKHLSPPPVVSMTIDDLFNIRQQNAADTPNSSNKQQSNSQDAQVLNLIHSAPRPQPENEGKSENEQVAMHKSDYKMKRQSADDRVATDNLNFMYEHQQQQYLTQRANSRQHQTSIGKSMLSSSQEDKDCQKQKFLLPVLQPSKKRGKKTLVLDLDETLVHSQFKPVSNADITLTINISNLPNQVMNQKVFACKRPSCDEFLEAVAPHYEIVMFTASLSRYADPLFKKLDPKGKLIDFCLYREHCTQYKRDFYVKDLTRLGRPIEDIIIVDNSPNSYLFQPQNAFPCVSWYDNQADTELALFIPIFDKIARFKGDVRRILRKICPKIAGNKVDCLRANKILDKQLRKQLVAETARIEQVVKEKEVQRKIDQDAAIAGGAKMLQQQSQVRPPSGYIVALKNSIANKNQATDNSQVSKKKHSKRTTYRTVKQQPQSRLDHHQKTLIHSSQSQEKNLLKSQKVNNGKSQIVEQALAKLGYGSRYEDVNAVSRNVGQRIQVYQTEGSLATAKGADAMCPNNSIKTAESVSPLKKKGGGNSNASEYYRKVMSDLRLKEKLLQTKISQSRFMDAKRKNKLQSSVSQSIEQEATMSSLIRLQNHEQKESGDTNGKEQQHVTFDTRLPVMQHMQHLNAEFKTTPLVSKRKDPKNLTPGTQSRMALLPPNSPSLQQVKSQHQFNLNEKWRKGQSHGLQLQFKSQSTFDARSVDLKKAMYDSVGEVVINENGQQKVSNLVDKLKLHHSQSKLQEQQAMPYNFVPKLKTQAMSTLQDLQHQSLTQRKNAKTPSHKMEIPQSILQQLSSARSYAAIQTPMLLQQTVQRSVLQPGPLSQVLTQIDTTSPHSINMAKSRKYSQQVDQINRENYDIQRGVSQQQRFSKRNHSQNQEFQPTSTLLSQRLPRELNSNSMVRQEGDDSTKQLGGGQQLANRNKSVALVPVETAPQIMQENQKASSQQRLLSSVASQHALTTSHQRHKQRLEQHLKHTQKLRKDSRTPVMLNEVKNTLNGAGVDQLNIITSDHLQQSSKRKIMHLQHKGSKANGQLYQNGPAPVNPQKLDEHLADGKKFINKIFERSDQVNQYVSEKSNKKEQRQLQKTSQFTQACQTSVEGDNDDTNGEDVKNVKAAANQSSGHQSQVKKSADLNKIIGSSQSFSDAELPPQNRRKRSGVKRHIVSIMSTGSVSSRPIESRASQKSKRSQRDSDNTSRTGGVQSSTGFFQPGSTGVKQLNQIYTTKLFPPNVQDAATYQKPTIKHGSLKGSNKMRRSVVLLNHQIAATTQSQQNQHLNPERQPVTSVIVTKVAGQQEKADESKNL